MFRIKSYEKPSKKTCRPHFGSVANLVATPWHRMSEDRVGASRELHGDPSDGEVERSNLRLRLPMVDGHELFMLYIYIYYVLVMYHYLWLNKLYVMAQLSNQQL